MKAKDERYVQSLKTVLQEKKVWERNELLEAFRKQLQAEAKFEEIRKQEQATATKLSQFLTSIKIDMNNKETLEEAADKDYSKQNSYDKAYDRKSGFIAGAHWQAKRMYSEEDMISFGVFIEHIMEKALQRHTGVRESFEQFKKKV